MSAKRKGAVSRTYRLREDLVNALEQQAAMRGKDRTALVEEALELYLSPTVVLVPSPAEVMLSANGGPSGCHRDADAPAEPAAR